MLYSIQNAFGEVYGIYEMPPTSQTASAIGQALSTELADILGHNGVTDAPLVIDSKTGEKRDRIVIDIDPLQGDESVRLARVHETIGRLTAPQVEQ